MSCVIVTHSIKVNTRYDNDVHYKLLNHNQTCFRGVSGGVAAMLGCSLARQLASIKSWSQSLQGVSGGFLGPARSYAEPSQVRNYQSGASSSIKRSLVQDLKYRFRYVVIIVMSFIFTHSLNSFFQII